MYKGIVLILFLCLCFLPVCPAYADVIVEPENAFYEQYAAQIVYLDRSFAANGEEGFVAVKNQPDASDILSELRNGEEVYISHSCLYNGAFWGYAAAYAGWVKLDEMLVLYDYVAFAEEYADMLYSYEGDYATLKATGSALAWPWPGAEAPLWTLEDLQMEYFSVLYAWLDEEGREWGFVPYLYGSRNIWVCLDDPLERNLPVLHPVKAPEVWVSETPHVDIMQSVPESRMSELGIAVILVAALAGGTAILIKVLWASEKHAGGTGNV